MLKGLADKDHGKKVLFVHKLRSDPFRIMIVRGIGGHIDPTNISADIIAILVTHEHSRSNRHF